MSLCLPRRACGCAFASDSINISGSGNVGDPLTLETYDGIATEAPDTRPVGANRFNGMRVYCTDTKRLFFWDAPTAAWVILSEPPQTWTGFTITQGATLTYSIITAWYQRAQGIFRAQLNVNFSSAGTAGGQLFIPVPAPLVNSFDIGGTFWYNDAGTAFFAGVLYNSGNVNFVRGYTADIGGSVNAFGNHPAVTVASGDSLSVTMTGRYA